ncbi:hypothetical protein CKO51_25425 [Rhodopirellula sp. SM50]|nr:hypothetical protein CKO51_25425 [Rhodopirellula sp. SM50]
MNPYEPPNTDGKESKKTRRNLWIGILLLACLSFLSLIWLVQAWYMLIPEITIYTEFRGFGD